MEISSKFSAKVQVIWDWSDTSLNDNKATTKQEAFKYSPTRLALVGGVEEDYPHDVIETRLRIRGRGRTAIVRYESTPGKDFVLMGHALEGTEQTSSEGRK